MAMCDYYLCDRCGNKAFFDANITDCRYTAQFDSSEYDEDWGVVDMIVLCPDCSKTHKVIFVERESLDCQKVDLV